MFAGQPNSSEILCGSRTTTGTLITIPAGKWYTGNLTVTASVAAAGTSAPTVTTSGTNVAPAADTVVGRHSVSGLLAAAAAGSSSTEVIILAPPENDVTLEFTAGAAGASSATVNGFIFG